MFFVPLLFCSTRRQWPPALSVVAAVRDTFYLVSVEKACSASSCKGKSVDQPLNPYLAGVPVVPVAPRVLVLPAGRAQSTRTAGIFDHPDYSNPFTVINSPSRRRSFSTSDPAQIVSSSQPSFERVVSYLNTRQSSAVSNNPLLRAKWVQQGVSRSDVWRLKPRAIESDRQRHLWGQKRVLAPSLCRLHRIWIL